MSGFKPLPALERLLVGVCLLMSVGEILGHQHGPGVKVVVEEDSDAVLPCSPSTKEDITGKVFDWRKDKSRKEVFFYDSGIFRSEDQQFRDRVSHFQDQLMNGNASIKIHNAKMADSGIYECTFPRLQPRQTFYIELVVERLLRDRAGEIQGASPEPYIRTLNATKDGSLLQCDVRRASPKPKVEWLDSAANILPAEEPQVSERGGRYYVTLKTTVTKTGSYRCVVTQEDISHQIYAETFMFISEDRSTKGVTGWLGGFVLGALVLAAVQAVLVATKRITLTCNGDSQRRRPSDDPEIVMSSKSPLSNGDSHPPDDPEIVMSSMSPLSNGDCHPPDDPETAMLSKSPLSNVGASDPGAEE